MNARFRYRDGRGIRLSISRRSKESHMSEPTPEQRILILIADHLDVDRAKLTMDANFIDDLGADSLDNVEILMAMEEEFDIEIPDDQAENILTVGQAVKYVTDRLGAPA